MALGRGDTPEGRSTNLCVSDSYFSLIALKAAVAAASCDGSSSPSATVGIGFGGRRSRHVRARSTSSPSDSHQHHQRPAGLVEDRPLRRRGSRRPTASASGKALRIYERCHDRHVRRPGPSRRVSPSHAGETAERDHFDGRAQHRNDVDMACTHRPHDLGQTRQREGTVATTSYVWHVERQRPTAVHRDSTHGATASAWLHGAGHRQRCRRPLDQVLIIVGRR